MGFVGDAIGSVVSGIGGMFGGSSGGGSYEASGVDLMKPFGVADARNSGNRVNKGLDQQSSFLNALQAQNGLGNQSSVFAQQQALANQYQNLANGVGPNPAMAQLANTTGQNAANQAALMAGQRGAGANAGLLARQIGMQGANIQQNSVGQAAALGAQQQLGAMNALQQQQGMMGNLATSQAGLQGNTLNAYNQAAQSQQQNILNAINQYNQNNVGMQSNMNNANAGIQGVNAQGQQGLIGGALSGIGSIFGLAHGGQVPHVPHYADGGMAAPVAPNLGGFSLALPVQQPMAAQPNLGNMTLNTQAPGAEAFQSNAGRFLFDSAPVNSPQDMGSAIQKGLGEQMMKNPMQMGAHNAVKGIGTGIGNIISSITASHGAVVPGQAAVAGDSLKNDKVPAMLSPKEIVLPRSVTLSKNAPEAAKKFVEAILARNAMRK